jgi:hypothetical protein
MAVEASTVKAKRDSRPVLTILASAALFASALVQIGTLASRFLMPSWPQWSGLYDIEFQAISAVLAVAVGVGAFLPSRRERTIVTGVGFGGFVGVALWPPWAMLDTGHPVPAWIGLLILVLMGASLSAGWREQGISKGRDLLWQIVAGVGIGLALTYSVLVVVLLWVVVTTPLTF